METHDGDVTETVYRASGAGGQHRNKTASAVRLKHESGLIVRSEKHRCQHRNRASAWADLRRQLQEAAAAAKVKDLAARTKVQIGSGMRGDKRRTVRTQDGRVVDHVSGRKWRLKDYLRGMLK